MAKRTNGPTNPSNILEQKIQKEIRINLTPEQKVHMADEAAKLSKQRDNITDELKAFMKAKRAELKAIQKGIDTLLDSHMKGFEMKEETVVETLDWDTKEVSYFFKDELIERREMHDSELQMKLNTNETLKKVVKPKKDNRTKAEKNPVKHLTPEELKSKEIEEVRREESGKKTKRSSVDKPLSVVSDEQAFSSPH